MFLRPSLRARAVSVLGPLLLCAGCGENVTPSTSATNTTGPNYGENKMPPAEKVAPKKGRGAASTGAPPQMR